MGWSGGDQNLGILTFFIKGTPTLFMQLFYSQHSKGPRVTPVAQEGENQKSKFVYILKKVLPLKSNLRTFCLIQIFIQCSPEALWACQKPEKQTRKTFAVLALVTFFRKAAKENDKSFSYFLKWTEFLLFNLVNLYPDCRTNFFTSMGKFFKFRTINHLKI